MLKKLIMSVAILGLSLSSASGVLAAKPHHANNSDKSDITNYIGKKSDKDQNNELTADNLFQPAENESKRDLTHALDDQQRFAKNRVSVAVDPSLIKEPGMKQAVKTAIDNWNSAPTNIKMHQVTYRNNADIVITPVILNDDLGQPQMMRTRRVTKPQTPFTIKRSVIEFDYQHVVDRAYTNNYTRDAYLDQAVTHALGHALGLGDNHNQDQMSVMSPEAVGPFSSQDKQMLHQLYSNWDQNH